MRVVPASRGGGRRRLAAFLVLALSCAGALRAAVLSLGIGEISPGFETIFLVLGRHV